MRWACQIDQPRSDRDCDLFSGFIVYGCIKITTLLPWIPHFFPDSLLFSPLFQMLNLFPWTGQDVRRGTLLLLQVVAVHAPQVIRAQKDDILDRVNHLTVKDKSLLRIVDLGPFRHTIDDALETRKAAFELEELLVERLLDVVNLVQMFQVIANGLVDVIDIKHVALSILRRLMEKTPAACSSLAPSLSPAFLTLFKEKPKKDAVAQEVERFNDLLSVALQVFVEVRGLMSAEEATAFLSVEKELEDGPLKDMYSALKVQH